MDSPLITYLTRTQTRWISRYPLRLGFHQKTSHNPSRPVEELIPSQVEKVTPRLVLAAAHISMLVEDVIKAADKSEAPSERIRRTLVSSVVFATEGPIQPKLVALDEAIHAYTMVTANHTVARRASSQANLFWKKGDCNDLAFLERLSLVDIGTASYSELMPILRVVP
jgi:hypothetical protein